MENKMKLNEEQNKVFENIENTNDFIYVTGKAGTGKSYLLKYFTKYSKKKSIVLAPTGVSALNVEGQTIHSFFGLPPDVLDPYNYVGEEIFYKTKEILLNIDVIIIDEISMVGPDVIECINIKCQCARGNKEPFGGLQVICFGDLYQLPPVVSDREIHRFYNDVYGGIFFFFAPILKTVNLSIFELENICRQTDEDFKMMLNEIREGIINNTTLSTINERSKQNIEEEGIVILASRNDRVARINQIKLSRLTTKEYTYQASITGNFTNSIFPTEKLLKLKVGSQVMMLVNDKNNRWVNGTVATITKLDIDTVTVKINDVEHTVDKHTWSKDKYYYDPRTKTLEREMVSSFTQFPVKLAWAVTIHKAQGQTYNSVYIDLTDGAFDVG